MPLNPTSLVDIIKRNKSKRLTANKVIGSNLANIPVLSKLNRSAEVAVKNDRKEPEDLNFAIFEKIHARIKNVSENHENIIKLFPDIELAMQIMISSILSPKKMTDTTLNYKIKPDFKIPLEVVSSILETLKTYMNEEYELEDKLPVILKEALFTSGAYAVGIIPESSVDEIINRDIAANISAEAFEVRMDSVVDQMTRPFNLLNTKVIPNQTPITDDTDFKTLSKKRILEYIFEEHTRITDNFNIAKIAQVKDKLRKDIVKQAIRSNAISTESLDKLQYIDIFRNRKTDNKTFEVVKTENETIRRSIGKPLFIRFNTESIIPVISPGDETKHIGYFVLLDGDGKPLSGQTPKTWYTGLTDIVSGSTNEAQLSITDKAYRNLIYDNTKDFNFNEIFDAYKEIIEYRLYNSIQNSIYDSNVTISDVNEIYYIMFTRALAQQKTNILFIPNDLITYFAFNYNEIGVGKSLLENVNILASMRAIVLFSKIIAYTKMSIDVTKVNVSLDPNDPDPEKTIEMIQDKVLKTRQNYFPLGMNNPVDLVDWIQRAGLQFNYENHPGLPNIKLDFENANLQHTVPQDELEEELRKRTIIAMGLSPETVDNGFNPEFATSVVNNNVLLSKRVSLYQKILSKHLCAFVNIVNENDEKLRSKLKDILEQNLEKISEHLSEADKKVITDDKQVFLNIYLNKLMAHIEITLPKPENTNITNLSAEFDVYKSALEATIDSIVSVDLMSEDISGEMSNHVDTVKNNFKHYLIRKWMSENNYLPELFELVNKEDNTSKNTVQLMYQHVRKLMGNGESFIQSLQKIRDEIDQAMKNIEGAGAEESSSSSASVSGGGSTDFGGGFGGIDETGGGEEADGKGGEGGGGLDMPKDDFNLDL